MAFDPHSLERLRELGRSLPKPLPKPEAPPPAAPASQGRHRLETETNPEALFRELMQASPDGTVPPHMIERLKQLEGRRSAERAPERLPERLPGPGGAARGKAQARARVGPDPDREQASLYTAFQALLLEQDEP